MKRPASWFLSEGQPEDVVESVGWGRVVGRRDVGRLWRRAARDVDDDEEEEDVVE